MEPLQIIGIGIVYFVVAFLGSITGGAGLITIPTLIFFGLSPYVAIGTSRVGWFAITTGGSLSYSRARKIDYKSGFLFMIFAAIGSVLGAFTVLSIPEQFIKKIVGIIIILLIALILLSNKNLGIKEKKGKKLNKSLFATFALGSGFYGGFIGSGIGIINRFVFAALFAFDMIKGAALSLFGGIAASIFSLIVFIYFGAVEYQLFIPIFTAAFLGAKYGIKLGNKWVKYLVTGVAIIMAIILLLQ